MSHDLRAPFCHIVGYAAPLAECRDALDQSAQHYLQSIIESVRTAGRLFDGLLNFFRPTRAPLQRTRVDVRKLFEEAWRSTQSGEPDREVDWRLDELAPGWGDPVLLRQALLNLLIRSYDLVINALMVKLVYFNAFFEASSDLGVF